MNIKITPLWDNRGPGEQLEFHKLIQALMLRGYSEKLLHFTDGSVLMEKMKPESFPKGDDE